LLLINDATSAIGCSGATHSTCLVITSAHRRAADAAGAMTRASRAVKGLHVEEVPITSRSLTMPMTRRSSSTTAAPRDPLRTNVLAASFNGGFRRDSSELVAHHVSYVSCLRELVLAEALQRREGVRIGRGQHRRQHLRLAAAAREAADDL